MNKKWKVLFDGTQVGTPSMIDTLFEYNHITEPEDFLNPSEKHLLPFDLFSNIFRAYDIVRASIKNGDKILIYGDVDTDGCTSCAILARYLRYFSNNVYTYMNKGKVHGITDDFETDCNTLIVVDSINSTPDKYLELLKKGIKIIVLDHHVPEKSVLDIKDMICLISSAIDNYPNPQLSGAGVAWKFVKYLDTQFGTDFASTLADLATVGIIADMCSVGPDSMENRYICNLGFSNLTNPAIKSLVGKYPFNAKAVSFTIAPLVNCAHRLENNEEALQLFLLEEGHNLKDLISNLKSYKEAQSQIVNDMYNDCVIANLEEQQKHQCMFFHIEGDRNFTGLVANKVLGDFGKPVVVYSINENNECTGSIRAAGLDSFMDIINSTHSAECFGHENAAGIKLSADALIPLQEKLDELLRGVDFVDTLNVFMKINPEQVTLGFVKLFKEINKISGMGFPEVLFMFDKVTDYNITTLNQKHMKVECPNGFTFIKWNTVETLSDKFGLSFSCVGTLDIDMWFGKPTMIITDYKFE